ncbi:MAG: N-acetylmuramoyl-L-alanine amidase [Ignavibacteria bacterium]|nr:N-acetylmuramoyl-L-alanine amidase [Ignavibacteria bacterium]
MMRLSFNSILLYIITAFLSIINFSVAQNNENQKDELIIVYPKPNQIVSDQDGYCLLLGRISNTGKSLFVNSEKVPVDKNGSFLYYTKIILPEITDSIYLSEEKFVTGYFIFELAGNTTRDTIFYPVRISKPLKNLPEDKIRIDENFKIEPSEDLILNPGELLEIKIKATPNCKATFYIEGEKEKFPLADTPLMYQFYLSEAVFGSGFKLSKDTIKGIYSGHLIIPDEKWTNKKIIVQLEHEKLGKKEFTLKTNITVNQSKQVRVVKVLYDPNLVIGRTGPMLGYRMFLPEGVKAVYDGERSGFYRLKLSQNQSIFVPQSSVEFMPEGTPPPKSTIEVIRTKNESNYVRVEIGLHERLPFEVQTITDPLKLKVKIFNAVSNIDWIYFDPEQSLIQNITWEQLNNEELGITISLNQKHLWGYSFEYEGNVLVLKIKKTPKIQKRFLFFGNPLKDIKIVLDPGHNSDDGAVGPSGLKEKDINLILAKVTKEVLEKEGAKVFLTREDNPLPLRERKAKVLSFSPDFSISIHNNAVPDGVNPLKHNGFSVYYYNQNAKELAFYLHEELKNKLNIPDFGLYWDNLYMCRISETIALLVEPTFIIHPEQEELLKQNEFQLKIANAIKDALIKFLNEMRE